jgi:hypothetical protein
MRSDTDRLVTLGYFARGKMHALNEVAGVRAWIPGAPRLRHNLSRDDFSRASE